jgi:hypothetical protein
MAVLNRLSKGRVGVGALLLGKNSNVLYSIQTGTTSITPGSVSANAVKALTFTLTGAQVNDMILVNPPALEAGLAFAGAAVTATDTVTIYIANITGSAVTGAAKTHNYTYLDFNA